MARGRSFERGEGWARVKELIELAKQADDSEWTQEQRERTFRRIWAKVQGAEASGAGEPRMTFVASS